MKKAWLGVFSALAVAAMGCSSSSSSGTTCPAGEVAITINGATQCAKVNTDGGTDTGVLPGTDSGHPGTDTGSNPDVKPVEGGSDAATSEGTVGHPCTGKSDTSCDPLGTGDNICDDIDYPKTPTCIGKTCDAGDGTTIMTCDPDPKTGTDLGVCYPTSGGSGYCFPGCDFTSTASPTGCNPGVACNVFGWDTKANGVGFCIGGCFADSDCVAGSKCQTETGGCRTTLDTYTLHPGDACTYKTASGATQDCNCFAARATDKGYCTQFCVVGTHETCPTGLKCTATLPATSSGSPLFTAQPSGLAGNCLKPCTADSDCTALNSTCQTAADGKYCAPFTISN